MRQRASWMMPADDRILEFLRDEGNATPRYVAEADLCSQAYASDRLSILAEYGLVVRLTRGLYTLSDAGRRYLQEELDASTLERQGDEG